MQTTALHHPSLAPEQQLLISQPSASLAAAQSWDFTQFTHGFSSGEVCKGADGRWHLIPSGCGHTELPPWTGGEHKHPPASPQRGFALISCHFLMNPQCCSLQGWAAVPKNLSAFPEGRSQTKSLSSPTQILPWTHPKSCKSTKCGFLFVFLWAAPLNHLPL